MMDGPERYFIQEWRSCLQPEITGDQWAELYGLLGADADPNEAIKHAVIIAALSWRQQQQMIENKINLNRHEEAERFAKIRSHMAKALSLLRDEDARLLDVWDGVDTTDPTLSEIRSFLALVENRASILQEAFEAEHDGVGKTYRHINNLYEELLVIWIKQTRRWPTVSDDPSALPRNYSGDCFNFVRAGLTTATNNAMLTADASIADQIEKRRQAAWDRCSMGKVPPKG